MFTDDVDWILLKYYLLKTVKDSKDGTCDKSCFNEQEVNDALTWVHNHVTSHQSFSCRPHSMSFQDGNAYLIVHCRPSQVLLAPSSWSQGTQKAAQ